MWPVSINIIDMVVNFSICIQPGSVLNFLVRQTDTTNNHILVPREVDQRQLIWVWAYVEASDIFFAYPGALHTTCTALVSALNVSRVKAASQSQSNAKGRTFQLHAFKSWSLKHLRWSSTIGRSLIWGVFALFIEARFQLDVSWLTRWYLDWLQPYAENLF